MNDRPIHPWRWRFIALWIIIFSVLVFWALRSNRSAITEINRDKASIASLERTNCALKEFLQQAEATRLHVASREKGRQRVLDLRAARGYRRLGHLFPQDGCQRTLLKP